jgi:hypothetical protein
MSYSTVLTSGVSTSLYDETDFRLFVQETHADTFGVELSKWKAEL